ncbi:MAG: hypothetical protein HY074_09950, partial [Deltaproteobacteria bacterium]|nr:hypothetical protein [Deltaproteobacteria bacterium]
HNRGCNLHTGIFGNQNLATPSFGRLVFSTGGANGSFGFTVCMFKRLDDEDVSSELMFHDSREWLEGNYHEHKDTLHYLPVSVCSSVDLTGAMPVFSSTTPKEALANLDTDYTIGTFRHQGNHASPFYRQSADAYVLSKMPQFCMKPCAPPIAKTTETKSEPVKTVAPAATVDATAPAQAGSDTSKTVAE